MSLQDDLDDLKAKLLASLPEVTADGLEQGREDVITTYLEGQALKPGDRAPEVIFYDKSLKKIRLADLLGDKHLVLSFFRGVWCPYCELELKALQTIISEIEARNAQLVAVSPELHKFTGSFLEANNIHYDVYTDLANKAAEGFGLDFEVPEGLRETIMVMNTGLAERYDDDCAWILPIPATYIISKDGIIQYAFVEADFTRRMEPADILTELDKL
jgi:peroxiredoxin